MLLPEPEAPTKAVVLPSSKIAEKLSSIFWSVLEGYLNDTFLNSILPFKFSQLCASLSSKGIYGCLSITSYAILPATLPSVKALKFGVASPNENTPYTNPRKQAIMSPEEYTFPLVVFFT